jgi:predicted peptidase
MMNARPLMTRCLLFLFALTINLHADDWIHNTYLGANGKSMPFCLLLPKDYRPSQKYPIVLFLHGSGERGTNNTAQTGPGVGIFLTPENRTKYPCFVVAPQCSPNGWWIDSSRDPVTGKRHPEPNGDMQLALKCLDEVMSTFKTDSNRVYVTGLSMGGFGAWDCITRFPERFAAGVPICGGGDPSTIDATVARVPVWVFHSANDDHVPVQGDRDMVAAMKKNGGNPHYTEFPDAGHFCWDKAYTNPKLMPWLFSQSLGLPDTSEP